MNTSKNNTYLYGLTIVSFSIGVAELAPMGLLNIISQYFNISIIQTSNLISYYAFGVVLGIPIISSLLSRFSVKNRILILTLIFSAGNFLCTVAWNYEFLLASRIIVAISHGTFFGESYLLASHLATENRKARNVSIISSGLAIASLIGVPLSTYLGLKISWRISFLSIAIIAMFAFFLLIYLLPSIANNSIRNHKKKKSILKIIFSKKILFPLATTVFGISGVFTVYSYITSILTEVTNISENNIPKMLFIYGLGNLIGNYLGGKFADKSIRMSVITSLTGLALSLLFLRFSFPSEYLMIIALLLFGVFAFMPITPLQMYIMSSFDDNSSFISSLNIGCFNLGNALGAFIGGRFLSVRLFGVNTLPYIAIGLTLIGLILAYVNLKKID